MSTVYLFNKQLGQVQQFSTDEIVYIPNEQIERILKEHEKDLSNNYGKIVLDKNDNAIYEPFMTKMLVNKEYYYFTEVPGDLTAKSDNEFDLVELTVKEYRENDNIRASFTDGSTQVMYFDGKFQIIKVPEGMTFDFKKKIVVRDVTGELNRLMMNFTKDNVEYNLKYNGFPFVVNNTKYLQPFRGMEDRSYYVDMRNNVEPKNRQVKFYKDKNGLRDSSDYDLIVGDSLSDAFLDNMIIKIVSYENNLKPAVEKFFEKVDSLVKEKNIDELIKLYNNQHNEVLKILEDIAVV